MKNLSALFLILLLFSCGASEKELKKVVSKKSFSTPFQGTIEAEEVDGAAIFKKTIKYSISKNLIKRESVLHKILNDKEINGIICDLNLNEVILYRVCSDKKFYVKLKLEEYLALRESLLVSNPIINNFLEDFPFGTIFVDLPAKGEYSILKNDVEVNSYLCKKSEIKHLNIHLVIDHCDEIIIDHKLLELVEVNFPEKIKGMAIFVLKKYSAIENNDNYKEIDLGKLNKILNKVDDIGSKIKSILSFKFTVKEIIEKEIENIEFKLDKDFLESKTFYDMLESTKIKTSGGLDLD